MLTTLVRDLRLVASNLRAVVLPGGHRAQPKRALRQWDLWGPSFFIIVLALLLSYSMRHHKSRVFAVVFATLTVGAVVNTCNVILLGGNIVFLQSLWYEIFVRTSKRTYHHLEAYIYIYICVCVCILIVLSLLLTFPLTFISLSLSLSLSLS